MLPFLVKTRLLAYVDLYVAYGHNLPARLRELGLMRYMVSFVCNYCMQQLHMKLRLNSEPAMRIALAVKSGPTRQRYVRRQEESNGDPEGPHQTDRERRVSEALILPIDVSRARRILGDNDERKHTHAHTASQTAGALDAGSDEFAICSQFAR